MLFKDAPDIISEFKNFIHSAKGQIPMASGSVSIMPVSFGNDLGPSWTQPDAPSVERPKKSIPPLKRKKRQVDAEMAPLPPARSGQSRVRSSSTRWTAGFTCVFSLLIQAKKSKHSHKPDASPRPFSPFQASIGPQDVQAQAPFYSTFQQSPAQHLNVPQSSHTSSAQGAISAPDELVFFDRAKKTLESRETYEDFLKLLNLFNKDIIDVKILVERAQRFLGENELLAQFKDIVGWDDKLHSVEHGPPGSIRTGPPEALTALPADDGEGPSYRRLPESVRYL
jgi:paired amphipathic helix protein Sin3a